MVTHTQFASPKIAKEMKKVFGSEAKTFSIKLKHKKAVGDFVRKIEKANKNTEKSTIVFG